MIVIKSDYEHQLFYRRTLDTLEVITCLRREDYLNTSVDSYSAMYKQRAYDRARENYVLVRTRYERERIARGWRH